MKIAAICALPLTNPGMLSVDTALGDVLRRHGIRAQVDYFCGLEGHVSDGGSSRFSARTYKALEAVDQLEAYDRIIIWGDFLQSRQYLKDIAAIRFERIERESQSEADAYARALFLLDQLPDSQMSKVICFGGSIYLNGPSDDWNGDYRRAVSRLYRSARLVLVRDPISAAFAQQYGAEGQVLGVDPSFLLEPHPQALPATRRVVGYSFGRAIRRERLKRFFYARRFVALCRRHAGLEHELHLDWLAGDEERPLAYLESKIDQLRQCLFVVTDTYHCAINAWREGVPAICLGYGSEHASDTLSEKKIELLYSMLNARQFYVFVERIGWRWGHSRARSAVAAALDVGTVESVKRNIDSAGRRAEEALVGALTGATGP